MNSNSWLTSFVLGAKNGWIFFINYSLPYIILAYAITQFLYLTGSLKLIGFIFKPVMAFVGLPGEAATAFVTSFVSLGSGVGSIISLFNNNIINSKQVVILFIGSSIIGSQLQYIGRILAMTEIKHKFMLLFIIIGLASSFMTMFIIDLLL